MPDPEEAAIQPPATLRPRVRDQVRHKLPEILLEAGSVVFAILLALGVDQWREERAHRDLARRARETILSELRANRAELQSAHRANETVVNQLQDQLAKLRAGDAKSVHTSLELAQLSGAAFQAAQSTQALQFVELDWLVRVARVYELQRTYVAAQEGALTEVGVAGGSIAGGDNPLRVMERVNSRLTTVQQIATGLLVAYERVLNSTT
jgi:hypothetical protein